MNRKSELGPRNLRTTSIIASAGEPYIIRQRRAAQAIEASSNNQCAREKERANPSV